MACPALGLRRLKALQQGCGVDSILCLPDRPRGVGHGEADASAVRGWYALDSDDLKYYHGKELLGKRLKDIKHLGTPGAILIF